MADEEIKGAVIKLAFDDSNFNKGMTDLKKQLTVIDSGFKSSVAGVKDWGSTLDGLKANADALGQKITVQKQIVDAYNQQLEKSRATLDKNVTTMSSLKEKLDTTKTAYEQSKASLGAEDAATVKLKEDLDSLAQRFTSSENAVVRAKSSVDGYTIQVNKATGTLNSMQSELTDTNAKIENFGKETESAGDKSAEFGNKSGGAIDTLSSALAAAGIAVAFSKIKEAITEATEAATTFEVGIAKIATIADTSSTSMDDIKSAITSLSNQTGKSTADLAEATYQAISAGIDTAKSVEFVSNAVKLSEGGFTSATNAVDVLTTAINAYGLSASDATDISDMLVTTQNLGKTTVDKLAGSLGTVIPIAAGLGVNIENLSAAYAVLTKNGVATDEAGTYIRAMLNSLSDTASDVSKTLVKETGKSFSELTKSGYSLGDVLKILDDSVSGDGTAFKNLWGEVRAGTGALSIINSGAENFNGVLSAMENSAGATEKAYKTMEDTAEHAQEKLTASANNFKAAVGSQLLPTLEQIDEAGSGAFEWASDFVKANPAVISMISALVAVVGTLAAAIVGYSAVVKIATFVTTTFNTAMKSNPGFLIASAIAAVTAAIAAYIITTPRATDETREYVASLKEADKASQEAIDSVNTQSQNTMSMVSALNELSAKEEKTAADKQSILSLVNQLNEAVPNLNLSYDQQTDSLNLTTDAIEKMAQAQAEQQLQQQYVDDLTAKYVARQEIAEKLKQAEQDLADATDKQTQAGKEAMELGDAYSGAETTAAIAVHDAKEAVDELTTAQKDNESAISDLTEKIQQKTEISASDTEATTVQIKSTEELKSAVDAQQSSEKTLASSLEAVSSALQEQSANGTLSLATINNLIDAGYAAALSVNEETGQVTLNKDAYIALTKAKLETQIADLNSLKTDIQSKLVNDGKAAVDTAGNFAVLAGAKALANDADYASYQSTQAQIAALTSLKNNLEKTVSSTQTYSKYVSYSAKSASSAAKTTSSAFSKAVDDIDYKLNTGAINEQQYWEQYQAAMSKYLKKGTDDWNSADEKVLKHNTDTYGDLFKSLQKNYEDGEIDLKAFISKSENIRNTYLKKNTTAWKSSYEDMFDQIKDVEANKLQDIKDNYDDALSDIQDKINDMEKNLLDVGGLTETITINDQDITKLSNLDSQTASINAFGDALQKLKDRGISSDMLSQIASMDVGEGTQTANLLLGLSESQWANEMAAWDAKQAAAKVIAESYYSDDVKTLKDKLTVAVTDLQTDMTNSGLKLGGNLTDGIVSGIQDGTINVAATMSSMMATAIAAAKKTAGIASPSKVMRDEVGKQLTAGTVQGIKDSTGNVTGSMSAMMSDIIAEARSLRAQATGAITILTSQVAASPPISAASSGGSDMLPFVNALLAGMSATKSTGDKGSSGAVEFLLNGVPIARGLLPDIINELSRRGMVDRNGYVKVK